ncbi:hypothetical protein [Maridesulfovibrio hydrothermalis]|uniref:Uncharacterized protein n=1 Tax=Maridesulfovibrio hydrothermalis AM13 = DSM 14728 TaxID=1121451 RepID=L0RFT4_9BACT|nr:hypothetical protein [Maridesulfovibrio hydrothermalis]CCO25097.1 conserved protein of unknown function [Maridesulfovibrio hydrothermalis AM13 = DSM 14728]
MNNMKHIVVEQPGVTIHREVPAMRTAEEFDVSQMSAGSREAFKRVCGKSELSAGPEDFQHVLECILTRAVVEAILK